MSTLQAHIADIDEIAGFQQLITLFTGGREAPSELRHRLVKVAGIELNESFSLQHVSDQRRMGGFGESARFAQLLIRLQSPAENMLDPTQEHQPLDREVALGGKGDAVAAEQRNRVIQVSL